jgi:septum site-determining protein MinC
MPGPGRSEPDEQGQERALGGTNGVEAFELRGTTLTVTVIRLLGTDLDRFAAQLDRTLQGNAAMFRSAPVLLDLEAAGDGLDLAGVVRLAREAGLVPVAVTGGTPLQHEEAAAAGVGLLGKGRQPAWRKTSEAQPGPSDEPEAAPSGRPAPPPRRLEAEKTMVVAQTVRSGQKIYAQGRDLVLLGSVSHGAEVLADGNIHAYGPMRGRMLAGAAGDVNARIFCRSLEAELVSIAGFYLTVDELPKDLRGKPAQIHLDGETLKIAAL